MRLLLRIFNARVVGSTDDDGKPGDDCSYKDGYNCTLNDGMDCEWVRGGCCGCSFHGRLP